jgi:hypothetical protein
VRNPHEEHVRNPSVTERFLNPEGFEEYDQIEDANELGDEKREYKDGEDHDEDAAGDEGIDDAYRE